LLRGLTWREIGQAMAALRQHRLSYAPHRRHYECWERE
jgi:hypothetical protein